MAKSSLSLSSPSLLLCSHLSFFPISFSKDPSSLTSSPDCIATKTDLCSGHHKKATILGCGRREIKPHHKDSIVSSPANSHKWDKYWCLFSRPPQGFASTWARYWSSPDLMVESGNALITNQTKKQLKFWEITFRNYCKMISSYLLKLGFWSSVSSQYLSLSVWLNIEKTD